MEPVGEFTPCFLRVVARFSAHADPNTLNSRFIIIHALVSFTYFSNIVSLIEKFPPWLESTNKIVDFANDVVLAK
jgi:hypothetical protein